MSQGCGRRGRDADADHSNRDGTGPAGSQVPVCSLAALLRCACSSCFSAGHVDIVQLLLHSGADVNAVNHNGDTALHCAVWKQHDLVVSELLAEQWKTRLDIKNHDGKTAEEVRHAQSQYEAVAACAASHTASF